jgi:hypothetical protein
MKYPEHPKSREKLKIALYNSFYIDMKFKVLVR